MTTTDEHLSYFLEQASCYLAGSTRRRDVRLLTDIDALFAKGNVDGDSVACVLARCFRLTDAGITLYGGQPEETDDDIARMETLLSLAAMVRESSPAASLAITRELESTLNWLESREAAA